MNKIRLLIADDHPLLRSGLKAVLTSQPDFEVVGEAPDGKTAVALVVTVQPDVILMDLQMPVMDGVSAIAGIRAQNCNAGILILTTYDTDADILRALDAGATGYLLKDAPHETLFRAIRATARGEAVLAPIVAARLVERVTSGADKALSSREIEVLEQVARGATNKEIGKSLHITEATVKSHLVHIFVKLTVDDRTAAVTTALERGLIRL